MKKNLIFLMLMTIFSLMSYAKNNNSTITIKDNVTINFKVNDESKSLTAGSYRYILEIYGKEDISSEYAYIDHIELNTNDFTVDLIPGTHYVCLFWVDKGVAEGNTSGAFDATSLKRVKLNSGKVVEEAFAARAEFIMPNNVPSKNITLKRAVAQIELIETGLVNIDDNIKVTFTGYKEFDVFNESVTGESTNISEVVTAAATSGLIGSFFTFASVTTETSGSLTISDMKVVYNGSITNTIPPVELSTNHRTLVRGKFATSN